MFIFSFSQNIGYSNRRLLTRLWNENGKIAKMSLGECPLHIFAISKSLKKEL